MRVLITRPEREATALATALGQRGHLPVIAPLFDLQILRPPADFAAALAGCQAVLLTSANGARALAEAAEQRSKPILAVGDTTASTAEGLGFTDVVSAAGDGAALGELARRRLDPAKGPLLHVSGVDLAGELAESLAPDGFEVRRFALYEARAADVLPDSARAALQARALDAATFFSPRASAVFVRLVEGAGLGEACRDLSAIAISANAAAPLGALPFKAVVTASQPTRQAVLDEIDRLPLAGVQGPDVMSDTLSSPPPPPSPPPPAVQVRRGLGVFGAFVAGLVGAAIVLAAALFSLPYWPDEARSMWRGRPVAPAPAPGPTVDVAAAVDAAKRELGARLDDLDKRVRAAAATAARADRPAVSDSAIADLRGRLEALEARPAQPPPGAPVAPAPGGETDKDLAAVRLEIATLRQALQTLDQTVVGQKDAIDKARAAAAAVRGADEHKALGAARASAMIAIAARVSAALEAGLPFAGALDLLTPLAEGDAKLTELKAALQPHAQNGVAARPALAAEFPAVAKAALADDLADDSFGQRLLGKLKGLISLRRVGADVAGDSVEAKLARAEAALDAGDLAKAVELVKALPPQAARATAAWLTRAEAHLAAQRAVDQLAAQAVSLLGTAR